MSPNKVGEVARKIWIFGRGKPSSKHFAPALVLYFRHSTAEEFGGHSLAGDEMFDFAARAIKHNGLSWIIARFAPDLAKEGCKAIVIIHRPPVERMIVALSALNAH